MTFWQRTIIGLVAAAALGMATLTPALAKPKHQLLVEKIQLQATVGQLEITSTVGAILTNVEEDLGWSQRP